jgi:hypothetical protein
VVKDAEEERIGREKEMFSREKLIKEVWFEGRVGMKQ